MAVRVYWGVVILVGCCERRGSRAAPPAGGPHTHVRVGAVLVLASSESAAHLNHPVDLYNP